MKRLEIRFAGQAFFDLNRAGNALIDDTVLLAGGVHQRMLYVPVPESGELSCMPAWTTKSCMLIDRSGQEYVAISLEDVNKVEVRNVPDGSPAVDLPRVLDLTGILSEAVVRQGARRTQVVLKAGLVEEQTIAGWITGDVSARRICSEIVWRGDEPDNLLDSYQIVLWCGGIEHIIRLPFHGYSGAATDPIVVFATTLCGWTGEVTPGGAEIDFDGPEELFGTIAAKPRILFSNVLKHPQAGGCPPSKRLNAQ